MIVTVSASYGAGGSQIAPWVAQQLGLPFVDRAVPVEVTEQLGISAGEAAAIEQGKQSRLWEFLATMSPASGLVIPPSVVRPDTERELAAAMETAMRAMAEDTGVVILGHAAAVVLADRVDALHVRLDGAPEGRVRAAVRQHGIDPETAEAQRKDNDRIRTGYVRHLYGADARDPNLYHLVLDTVRLSWDCAQQLVLDAVTGLVGGGRSTENRLDGK